MIVRGAGITWLYSLFFTICMMVSPVFAANETVLDQSKVIAIVPLTQSGVTQDVYRHIDRIVPDLKKLPSQRIVKLECSYNGSPKREHDVLSAYRIAGRVEKYLRERHQLNLDLWIAAYISKQKHQHRPALTFSVFTDELRNLQKAPVVPFVSPAE